MAGVGHREHFEFCVEVVDHVERDGFGGFGFDGGAELQLAVMRGDEVKEVQADILRGGFEGFPVIEREFSPERIYHLDADRDMSEEFATEFARDAKTRFGRAHFPKFAAIVEKDSGEEEVTI